MYHDHRPGRRGRRRPACCLPSQHRSRPHLVGRRRCRTRRWPGRFLLRVAEGPLRPDLLLLQPQHRQRPRGEARGRRRIHPRRFPRPLCLQILRRSRPILVRTAIRRPRARIRLRPQQRLRRHTAILLECRPADDPRRCRDPRAPQGRCHGPGILRAVRRRLPPQFQHPHGIRPRQDHVRDAADGRHRPAHARWRRTDRRGTEPQRPQRWIPLLRLSLDRWLARVRLQPQWRSHVEQAAVQDLHARRPAHQASPRRQLRLALLQRPVPLLVPQSWRRRRPQPTRLESLRRPQPSMAIRRYRARVARRQGHPLVAAGDPPLR